MCAGVIGITALIVGCSKNQSADNSTPPGTQNMSMYLTDGPGRYDVVNLDILSVQLLVDTSTNTRRHDGCDWDEIGRFGHRPDSTLIWENLTFTAGVYNILSLSNGVDTLLAQSNIPVGAVRLIKINLGTNNTVMKDSVSYPLQIPVGAPSYILVKLQGDEGEWDNFKPRHFRLWLDFDVQRSIIQINSTTYYLRPVVNFFTMKNTGSIGGLIRPLNTQAVVSVYSSGDTAYAIPNWGGMFLVRGLSDGTYSAKIHSYNGYKDTTISNITIMNASRVNEGIITLHK